LKNKYKILIPGGTGFIGYHLSNYLAKKEWTIHSLSKFKPKKSRRVKGVKYIYCDVRNKKELHSKLDRDYDFVVNLSGYVDHGNNKIIRQVHFGGCRNIISTLNKKKLKKFIQIGSSVEYGKLKSPQKENLIKNKFETKSIYGNSKLETSLYLKKLFKKIKFPVVILRLYLVYGPKQDNNRVIPFVINNCLKNKTFNCSSGLQFRDFTYIDDAIKAIYKCFFKAKAEGEIINIGCGKPIKLKSLIMKIVRRIKSGVPIFSKIKLRKDESLKLYPDIRKANELIKWYPKVSLELGLKKTIKFYR
jgi:nucleoside-diphosphate-sugar epimerase